MTYPPVARTTDPATSHMAEAQLDTATRDSHVAQLVRLVKRNPGAILEELAHMWGRSPEATAKRLSDAQARKLLHTQGTRKASTNRMQRCWFPMPATPSDEGATQGGLFDV